MCAHVGSHRHEGNDYHQRSGWRRRRRRHRWDSFYEHNEKQIKNFRRGRPRNDARWLGDESFRAFGLVSCYYIYYIYMCVCVYMYVPGCSFFFFFVAATDVATAISAKSYWVGLGQVYDVLRARIRVLEPLRIYLRTRVIASRFFHATVNYVIHAFVEIEWVGGMFLRGGREGGDFNVSSNEWYGVLNKRCFVCLSRIRFKRFLINN